MVAKMGDWNRIVSWRADKTHPLGGSLPYGVQFTSHPPRTCGLDTLLSRRLRTISCDSPAMC